MTGEEVLTSVMGTLRDHRERCVHECVDSYRLCKIGRDLLHYAELFVPRRTSYALSEPVPMERRIRL